MIPFSWGYYIVRNSRNWPMTLCPGSSLANHNCRSEVVSMIVVTGPAMKFNLPFVSRSGINRDFRRERWESSFYAAHPVRYPWKNARQFEAAALLVCEVRSSPSPSHHGCVSQLQKESQCIRPS